ncbi:MAG: maleylpyruvate isomerase N-terminal domain-containing protein, partial [Acidimicrobiia bacterium]
MSSFLVTADAFCRLAERDEVAARWADESALVGYTVGGLVGHVAAGVGWLEPLLESAPPTDAAPITFSGYCTRFMVGAPDDLEGVHMFAREQGERGAQRGHREALARLRGRVERLQVLLVKEDGDRLLDLRPLVPAAIPRDEFIRTR